MKQLLLLWLFILMQGAVTAQQHTTDSLKHLLLTATDTSKVNVLLELSAAYNGEDKAKAIEYAKLARKLSQDIGFHKGEAYALKSLGMAYVAEGNYPKVLSYWQQSLGIFNRIKDNVGASNMLNNMGVVYSIQGWDAKAIEYYLRSLKRAEVSGDKLRIATALLNIGAHYNNNPATHDKALAYYLQALPLSKEVGDKTTLGTLTVNIGEIYFEKGADEKAMDYYQDALAILEASGDKNQVAYTLNNIGKVYTFRGDLAKAMEQHLKARSVAEAASAKLELTQALNYIGDLQIKTGKGRQALATHKSAERLATELGATYDIKDALEGIAKAYGMLADYKNAYAYQNQLLAIKDTLYNAETSKKIENLQANYENEKKQAQIDLLTKDKELQQASLQRQGVLRNALLVVLGLIIVIAFVLFLNFRNKVKANILLKHKNAEINTQKEEISAQRDHIEDTFKNLVNTQQQLLQSEKMASLGQLTAGVAHEINNPINFVSAGIDSLRANFNDIMEVVQGYLALKPEGDNQLKLQQLEKLKEQLELEDLIDESGQLLVSIKNGATRTKEIVKSLKNFTRLDESSLKKADIHEGIDSTLVILNNQLKDRIKVVKNYGDLEEIYCYPGQLNQVFMNILSNAAHAINGEGTIFINTSTDDDHAVIRIKDTGMGMTEDVKQHIFDPFYTTKDVGVGTGLGLSISYGIVEKHHGKIDVESQPGVGTEFIIRIPLVLNETSKEMEMATAM